MTAKGKLGRFIKLLAPGPGRRHGAGRAEGRGPAALTRRMHGTEAALPPGSTAGATWCPRAARCWTSLAAAGGTCAGSRERGHPVAGVDRDAEALAAAGARWARPCVADIENGPWPLAGPPLRRGGRHQLPVAAAASRASWQPWRRAACCSTKPSPQGNETVGKPSRAGLPAAARANCCAPMPGLRVVAYEDGFLDEPAALRPADRRRARAAGAGRPRRCRRATCSS